MQLRHTRQVVEPNDIHWFQRGHACDCCPPGAARFEERASVIEETLRRTAISTARMMRLELLTGDAPGFYLTPTNDESGRQWVP